MRTDHQADYIVVGAGSAGSVVAARLSEDGRRRVLLLEAGGSDRRLAILMPAATMLLAITNPRYDWRFMAEPDPTRDGREDYMPRGKVLGGTSSINATSFIRGAPEDYNGWAALGCRGWDFDTVLPYFRRLEDYEGGANEYRGTGGPLSVSHIRSVHPLSRALIESCVKAGMTFREDINEPPQMGVGYMQASQRKGWRHSASRAYLWPAKGRDNLRIVTHAQALGLTFEGTRATGVEYLRRGKRRRATAAKAVVLCAGSFGSPQLLMLSGVGPEAHLREHGIEVLHDLPGVGENMQDHAGISQTVWVNRKTYNVQTGPLSALMYGAQWLLFGTGPASTPIAQVCGYRRCDPSKSRSHVQYLFSPAGYDLTADGPEVFRKACDHGPHEPASALFSRHGAPRLGRSAQAANNSAEPLCRRARYRNPDSRLTVLPHSVRERAHRALHRGRAPARQGRAERRRVDRLHPRQRHRRLPPRRHLQDGWERLPWRWWTTASRCAGWRGSTLPTPRSCRRSSVPTSTPPAS